MGEDGRISRRSRVPRNATSFCSSSPSTSDGSSRLQCTVFDDPGSTGQVARTRSPTGDDIVEFLMPRNSVHRLAARGTPVDADLVEDADRISDSRGWRPCWQTRPRSLLHRTAGGSASAIVAPRRIVGADEEDANRIAWHGALLHGGTVPRPVWSGRWDSNPPITCYQSTCIANYATPRRFGSGTTHGSWNGLPGLAHIAPVIT